MEDKDILQHLLVIERQAAALVDDAQAEADRRIKEAEEHNRLAYEEKYQARIAELETEYQKKEDAVRAEYDKALDEYRLSLEDMPRDNKAFSALAHSLLFGEK
jgi:vacuolar-type H+-ATPase subunit H